MISSKTSSSFLYNLFKLKKPYIPKNYNPNNNGNFNYKFSLPTNINNNLNNNFNNNQKFQNGSEFILNKNNNKTNLVFKNSKSKLNSSNNLLVNYNNNNSREFSSKNQFHSTNKSSISKKSIDDLVRNDGIDIVDNEYESYLKQMEKNISLKIFLKNCYLSTSMGFGGSVLTGLIFSHFVESGAALGPAMVGLIGSLASIYIFNKQSPRFETIDAVYEKKDKNFVERSIVKVSVPHYSTASVAAFIGLCVSNGLLMSPLLAIVPGIAIGKALVMGGLVTGGSSYFALRMKPEAMTPYRPVLYGSLFGLVSLGLLSIASHLIWGPNVFTQTVHSIDLYGGLLLFTALNAYDTQEAVNEFNQTGRPDFLRVSMSLVLNAINIFIRLLHIQRDDN